MPVAALGRWAGTDELQVELDAPVAVDVGDRTQMVEDGGTVAVADLPAVFSDPGGDRERAHGAAGRGRRAPSSTPPPCGRRPSVPGSPGASPSPQAGPALSEVLRRITSGNAQVELFPAGTRVAEGQFAFVPDAEAIQAGITRRVALVPTPT